MFGKRKQQPPQKTNIIESRDGACVMLLPNLLMHNTLKAQGKTTIVDFNEWIRATYGNVKLI